MFWMAASYGSLLSRQVEVAAAALRTARAAARKLSASTRLTANPSTVLNIAT